MLPAGESIVLDFFSVLGESETKRLNFREEDLFLIFLPEHE